MSRTEGQIAFSMSDIPPPFAFGDQDEALARAALTATVTYALLPGSLVKVKYAEGSLIVGIVAAHDIFLQKRVMNDGTEECSVVATCMCQFSNVQESKENCLPPMWMDPTVALTSDATVVRNGILKTIPFQHLVLARCTTSPGGGMEMRPYAIPVLGHNVRMSYAFARKSVKSFPYADNRREERRSPRMGLGTCNDAFDISHTASSYDDVKWYTPEELWATCSTTTPLGALFISDSKKPTIDEDFFHALNQNPVNFGPSDNSRSYKWDHSGRLLNLQKGFNEVLPSSSFARTWMCVDENVNVAAIDSAPATVMRTMFPFSVTESEDVKDWNYKYAQLLGNVAIQRPDSKTIDNVDKLWKDLYLSKGIISAPIKVYDVSTRAELVKTVSASGTPQYPLDRFFPYLMTGSMNTVQLHWNQRGFMERWGIGLRGSNDCLYSNLGLRAGEFDKNCGYGFWKNPLYRGCFQLPMSSYTCNLLATHPLTYIPFHHATTVPTRRFASRSESYEEFGINMFPRLSDTGDVSKVKVVPSATFRQYDRAKNYVVAIHLSEDDLKRHQLDMERSMTSGSPNTWNCTENMVRVMYNALNGIRMSHNSDAKGNRALMISQKILMELRPGHFTDSQSLVRPVKPVRTVSKKIAVTSMLSDALKRSCAIGTDDRRKFMLLLNRLTQIAAAARHGTTQQLVKDGEIVSKMAWLCWIFMNDSNVVVPRSHTQSGDVCMNSMYDVVTNTSPAILKTADEVLRMLSLSVDLRDAVDDTAAVPILRKVVTKNWNELVWDDLSEYVPVPRSFTYELSSDRGISTVPKTSADDEKRHTRTLLILPKDQEVATKDFILVSRHLIACPRTATHVLKRGDAGEERSVAKGIYVSGGKDAGSVEKSAVVVDPLVEMCRKHNERKIALKWH